MRSLLLWDVTQCRVAVSYCHFGIACQSHLQGSSSRKPPWATWPLKMIPISCPEMAVTNCQSTLNNIWGERRPHLLELFETVYFVLELFIIVKRLIDVPERSSLRCIVSVCDLGILTSIVISQCIGIILSAYFFSMFGMKICKNAPLHSPHVCLLLFVLLSL